MAGKLLAWSGPCYSLALCNKKPVGVVNIVVTVPGARKEAEAFPEVLLVA